MGELVATRYAVRVMGVWVRRADALLQDGAVANAARAVLEQQHRLAREAGDLAAVELAGRPALTVAG